MEYPLEVIHGEYARQFYLLLLLFVHGGTIHAARPFCLVLN